MEEHSTPVKRHSAGGSIYKDGKYLIIYWVSKKSYELPKGTIEPGETPEDACIREIKEETGYTVNIVTHLTMTTINYVWTDGIHYEKMIDYYLMQTNNEKPEPKREAHEDFINVWCTYDDAMELLTFDNCKEALTLAHTYATANNL